MHVVFAALDRLGIRYCVTGSVAASAYGVLRQSLDTDVLVDLDARGFGTLADELRATHSIAEPIDFGDFAMASVIDIVTGDKVDLILRRPGSLERSAFDRRRRQQVPGLGDVWVLSLEDLVLAKLLWSEGTSELQLRDCAQLLRIDPSKVDRAYLVSWAERLGIADRLTRVSDAA